MGVLSAISLVGVLAFPIVVASKILRVNRPQIFNMTRAGRRLVTAGTVLVAFIMGK